MTEPTPDIFTAERDRPVVKIAQNATLVAMQALVPSLISMPPSLKELREMPVRSLGLVGMGMLEPAVAVATGLATGKPEAAAITYPLTKLATATYKFVAMHVMESARRWITHDPRPATKPGFDLENAPEVTRLTAKTVGLATEVLLPACLTARKVKGGFLGGNRFIQGCGEIADAVGYPLAATGIAIGKPEMIVTGATLIAMGKTAVFGSEIAEHFYEKTGGVVKLISDIPIAAVNTVAATTEKIANVKDKIVRAGQDWQQRLSQAKERLKRASERIGIRW